MPKAVVTGASGKLGRILCRTLARRGYALVLHAHTRGDALRGLEEELAAMGCRASSIACDFTGHGGPADFARECFDAETTVLINSAACFSKGRMGESSAEDLARIFALNTFAPYELIAHFAAARARAYSRERGLVINILDTKIFQTASGYAAYTLSKKSLAEITRLAACEYPASLRVNAIAPACLSPDDESYAALSIRAPLGNPGREEDLALALEFFLQAESVTGQCLSVDGGLSVRGSFY